MIVDFARAILQEHQSSTDIIKIGYLREFLQSEVLEFISKHKVYRNLIFYGGTAMRFLLKLDRLSEDLDFIGRGFQDFEALGADLSHYFASKGVAVDYKVQKFRITLKFRMFLGHFNLKFGNSQDLYIKLEISDHFDFCQQYTIKYYPIVYHNKSMIVASLDESTLFATKLNAVLYRQRSKKNSTTDISVKGRDFYDLFWYLQRGFVPNIDCIEGISSMDELKTKLLDIVEHTDFGHVVVDIRSFVEDTRLLEFIEDGGKAYLIENIKRW